MSFRRFLQHFQQQQWVAIATELVIVIIAAWLELQAAATFLPGDHGQ